VPAEAQLDPSDPKQTTAFSGDMNPVQTAASRFADNTATLKQLSLAQKLVPQPLQVSEEPGVLAIKGLIIIIQYPPTLQNEAKYLQAALQDVVLGIVIPLPCGHARGPNIFDLSLDPALDVDGDGQPDREGYTLRVSGSGVQIVGTDAAGVLHGIQTLRQLMPISACRSAAMGLKCLACRSRMSQSPTRRSSAIAV
jgi:hexosaminidase